MNVSETSLHYIYLKCGKKGAIVAVKKSLTNIIIVVPCLNTFRTKLRYVTDEFDVYLVRS